MSIETWKAIADWATIFFIALTVVSGSTALILGDRINDKQAEQLRTFSQGLTAAKTGLSIQETRAADAERQLDLVKKHVDTSAAEAKRKAEELHAQNLATESKLEEERKTRLEMEAAIAPRLIDQQKAAEELKAFAGMSVRIESLAESEPWRLAGQLAATLELMASWHVLPGMQRFLDTTSFQEGVTVEMQVGLKRAGDRSEEAARALVATLKKNNIDAHMFPAIDLPVNTLRVRIGLKPITHFGHLGGMLYK